MKSFKKILSEVAQPKSGDEQSFKDKHLVQVTSHPVASDHQHSGETETPADKIKRKAKRIADYDYADDIAVYEGMDLDDEDLDKRYERERKKEIRDKIIDEKKLDPVGQEDGDIDNDGDVDGSDKYLHNRRKVIAKAMKESLLDITEKAKSQSQQKAAGIALAVKRGELPKSALIGAAKDMFKMSEKDLEDFASTKHKGLPEKIDESAFVAKAAYSHKSGKKNFKLGDKEYPVTIKKDVADEIAEAKTDIYHKHMLKALGKSRLPKYHPYTSSIANNGDFVVYDGGGRIAGRIPKGEHDLKEAEQIDEISRDLARSYIRKVSDKNNTGEASPKEVMKRSPGVALAGKKAYGIGGKARVNATEEVDLDENFKTGLVKLDDGSSVILKDQDAKLLNQMFKDLNAANKKKMMKAAMTDKSGFEEILGFAREALDESEAAYKKADRDEKRKSGANEYNDYAGQNTNIHEESELDEISTEKKMAYGKAAFADYNKQSKSKLGKILSGNKDTSGESRKIANRLKGIRTSSKTEESEIDEANQVKMRNLKVGDTVKLAKRFGGKQGKVHKVHKDGADIVYGDNSPTFAHHSNFTKINVAKEEVQLDENFKPGLVKLDDGSSVILKDQDSKLLNQMFKDLNSGNRKKMMKAAMSDKAGFEEILGFAREAL